MSTLLPRAVGQPRALALLLTRRSLNADEALAWGLVAEVVDDEQVLARAMELAAELAAGPTPALGQAKRLVRASWETTTQQAAEDEADTIARLAGGPEAASLIESFVRR